ncbi:hypothetical protein H8356DRAFT_1029533 [Neocallimastix lanati (nom. inval.)]|nr:hypothetical protein H8356DRAFT_1029533 [Neocallimastix sp. JGI-2020a]
MNLLFGIMDMPAPFLSFSTLIGIGAVLCFLFSHILSVIGALKSNISYLIQYDIVFFLLVLFELFNFVRYLIYIKSNEYIENSLKTLKDTNNLSNIESKYLDKFLIQSLNLPLMITVVEFAIILFLMVNSYLISCNDDEKLIEDILKKKNNNL